MTRPFSTNLAVVLALALSGTPVFAADSDIPQKPTFYSNVLPILQENCQLCHRPAGANLGGMVAPMSFTTYESTRPWAKAMERAVESGVMPPWHAAKEHAGQFSNERSITDIERDTIIRWVRTGASKGNPKDAPAPVEFDDGAGWAIGEPDLVLRPNDPYVVADDMEDEYVYLSTDMQGVLEEDRFIKGVEFRPGSSAVHHIITVPLGGLVPGGEPMIYPEGVGSLMRKDFDLIWEMHYHKEAGPGTAVTDHSEVAITFYDKPEDVKYRVQRNDLGRYDLEIPAGASNFAISKDYKFKYDTRIISFQPHFHLRGKAAKYVAYYPDGKSETLLNIPRYDFNWQTTYTFEKFKEVPAGTRLTFTTTWDNSAENPYNPDATKIVRYGLPTTSEMSLGYMSFINESDEYEDIFDTIDPFQVGLIAVVATFDSDDDGKLHRDEEPTDMAAIFAVADLDKDGYIDMDEARAADAAELLTKG